jgi:hypothetical protein
MDAWRTPEGFAAAMRLTKALISEAMGGRPPVGRPERCVQYARKRRRCHRKTVSGVTITRDCFHPAQTLAKPDPEEAITSAEPRPGRRSFVHSELLTQGQILKGQLAMAAQEEGEKPKQVV